jgi:hypothetical protein
MDNEQRIRIRDEICAGRDRAAREKDLSILVSLINQYASVCDLDDNLRFELNYTRQCLETVRRNGWNR